MPLARSAVLFVLAVALSATMAVAADDAAGPFGGCAVFPAGLAVDPAGNAVLEPNETAVVAPTWGLFCAASFGLNGTLSNHTGPAGPVYSIPDAFASYSLPPFGSDSCLATGNCYSVRADAVTRPVTHWDSTVFENVSLNSKTWTLHIGASFTDVPTSNGFYRFVETILHKGVTGGCGATTYCPSASTTRAQLAVFVLVAKQGPGYSPVPCGATPMFSDVPPGSPFCRFVEELARRGVVGGCGGGSYCASSFATRDQMAVIVLRTLDPALSPPACVTPVFADVPASSPFCPWVEELVRRGVVSGCGGGNYCPTAPITRDQMAVFLTVTFGLTLYGV